MAMWQHTFGVYVWHSVWRRKLSPAYISTQNACCCFVNPVRLAALSSNSSFIKGLVKAACCAVCT